MIEVLKQLRVLHVQSGKSQNLIAENTGYSKSTISNVLSGKSEDVRLQTVIDIAAELGAEVALLTAESEKAISQQDVTFYRDEMAARDSVIEELREELRESQALVDTLRNNITASRNNVDHEMERVRAEYRDDILFYKQQLELLRDQLRRKDRYIDILIETASKGGDLKAVDVKKTAEKDAD